MSKPYDLVVFGATGYTGQLVCQYLLTHPSPPTWAIAARSRSRLTALQTTLNLPRSVGIIQAETSDYVSLVAMTAQARVVVNIVGPYRPLNACEVVRACVETGTNYVDLSGETGFNSDLIQRFHSIAQHKAITIAPSVGFDSLPFDVSTYLAVQKANQLSSSQNVVLVECAYELPNDLSAGTLASAVSMASEKEQMFSVRGDWLSPIPNPNSLSFGSARFFPQRRQWGAQNTFSIHNTRMVMRSWGLLQHHSSTQTYGDKFCYKEGAILPSRFRAIVFAYLSAVGIWVLMNSKLVRWMVARSMAPNSGPSSSSLANSTLRVDTVARAESGEMAICSMSAKGHPGYLLTARMIVETALTIIDDEQSKTNPLGKRGGVLTPALVGAERLADRLVRFAQFEISTQPFEPTEADKSK